MSTRAIAPIVGVSVGTVHADREVFRTEHLPAPPRIAPIVGASDETVRRDIIAAPRATNVAPAPRIAPAPLPPFDPRTGEVLDADATLSAMTEHVRAHLTVLASPPFASMLVSMLRDEGVEVEWTPPEERRGGGEVAQQILIGIVAAGAYDGIKLAVQRFIDRTQGRAKVELKVEGPPRHAR